MGLSGADGPSRVVGPAFRRGRLTGRPTVRKTDGLRITGRGKPQLIQVFAVRPHLTRRSNRILAGAYAPRSNGHHVYIALEAVKVIALLTTGILLLSST